MIFVHIDTCDVFFILFWCTEFFFTIGIGKKSGFHMHPLFSNVGIREIDHVWYLFEVVSLKEFFSHL